MLFSFGLTFWRFFIGRGFFFQFFYVEILETFAHKNQAKLIEFKLEKIKKIPEKKSRKMTNVFKGIICVHTRCYCEFWIQFFEKCKFWDALGFSAFKICAPFFKFHVFQFIGFAYYGKMTKGIIF